MHSISFTAWQNRRVQRHLTRCHHSNSSNSSKPVNISLRDHVIPMAVTPKIRKQKAAGFPKSKGIKALVYSNPIKAKLKHRLSSSYVSALNEDAQTQFANSVAAAPPRSKNPQPFAAPSGPVAISFHRSSEMSNEDMRTCYELVKHTSSADYKASASGWHPQRKQEEMRDVNMYYFLARRSAPASGSPAATISPNPVLGFLSFMFTHDDPPHTDRSVVYIYEVHLSEELRGGGLGSYLVSLAEDAAVDHGDTKTMLTVFARNKRARALYEKLGYARDQCSPADRQIRGRRIEADYTIMSKDHLQRSRE